MNIKMESTFCQGLYNMVGATTDQQKFGMSALTMAVLVEPMNRTGCTWDKFEEVETVVYGESSLTTRIATLAGLGAGNELLDEVQKVFPDKTISYNHVFEFLEGKEVIPGVYYKV